MKTAAGIVIGALADTAVGDPRRWHPVAGFGRLAGTLERKIYAPSRAKGALFTLVCVSAATLVGAVLDRFGVLGVTAATWTALGGRSLAAVGDSMADALESGDLVAARALVPSLCGRDPEALDEAGICRAAVESIAENTSDAAVAPLLAAAVAGAPGVLAYRAINTLDAMVGYRNDRYREFGWASARLDDVANYVPARLSGVLAVLCGPSPASAVATWRRDARRHPSPNAGVVEAAFAGALDLSLGGTTAYHGYTEERPVLGTGRAPQVEDLRAAVRLSRRVRAGAVVVAVAIAFSRGRSGRRACV
ncbi:cobalamin biosynthesis protein CobD [Gordonia araii NBRC 100433]|uniref:Cobalamin biosynthesis protein CobD n=1 Tax=Gordonia araii NBRC 100433 TaxID=1073574 RepID=G7GZI4_9ACTN|nr:cobalamin biosynthesis protein [Gordonia araii]NNG97921.1 cobalamin biosynthesis protein [Gordonia araii NBRC 100433]GAB09009.1 cobalamin biosynthesis protein CobD [Gordonia araii NBRC 100433]